MSSSHFHKSLIVAAALAVTVLAGCDRRTPEERLATAVQFYQQGDAASAEMEALKAVEKAPDDPIAVQASVLLAQIYGSQNRLEEAQMQLESALQNVSQLDPMGKEVLRMYLGSLTGQKKYDEAIKAAEKYQKEYAQDPGTSLSLRVARADIQTAAGQTTGAREELGSIMKETTSPAEMALYRELYTKTYLRDENTTDAVTFLSEQLARAPRPEDKMSILTSIAQIQGFAGNYQPSRQALEQLTAVMTESFQTEKGLMNLAARGLQLGQAYLSAENLPGAGKTFKALYDADLQQPEAVQAVINHLMEVQMRLGETSATETLLQDAAKKYPQGPFNEVLRRMHEVIAKGQLQQIAPQDTSPLVMKYKADPNILWPESLPQLLSAADRPTTGTATTSGTAATTATENTSGTK